MGLDGQLEQISGDRWNRMKDLLRLRGNHRMRVLMGLDAELGQISGDRWNRMRDRWNRMRVPCCHRNGHRCIHRGMEHRIWSWSRSRNHRGKEHLRNHLCSRGSCKKAHLRVHRKKTWRGLKVRKVL